MGRLDIRSMRPEEIALAADWAAALNAVASVMIQGAERAAPRRAIA